MHRGFFLGEVLNQMIKDDLSYISFNMQIEWWIEPDIVSRFSFITTVFICFSLLEIEISGMLYLF